MQTYALGALVTEQLEQARRSAHGRSAQTVHRGREHLLWQTLLALVAGQALDEHENPGEATLHVLDGHVRLAAGDETIEGRSGDLLAIPHSRHSLTALADSAVLLTVAKRR